MNKLLVMGIFLLFCHNVFAATAKLQYLWVTSGGMMAFYDDGNVKMCPRCEPAMLNLKSMESDEPYAHWKQTTDVIKMNSPNGESDYELYEKGHIRSEWRVFDYKTIKPLF